MNKPNQVIKTYRYQLFPSAELIKLIGEAVRVSPDSLIAGVSRGWFARLVRASLTCYIAYCKTMAQESSKAAAMAKIIDPAEYRLPKETPVKYIIHYEDAACHWQSTGELTLKEYSQRSATIVIEGGTVDRVQAVIQESAE